MNHTDLIKQLRDALYFRQPCTHKRVTRPTEENNWLSECRDCGAKNHLTLTFGHDRERAREIAELIAEADAYLASGGWVRVKDALPVVPEGKKSTVVWVTNKHFGIYKEEWSPRALMFDHDGATTHWQYYVDPTPNPPEQTMNTVVQEHWNGDEDMARGHAAITAEMSTEVDAREAYVARGEQLMYTLKRAVRNDHDDVSTKADCDALQAAHTALVDHLRTQPEGYVLLPVKPTRAMLVPFDDCPEDELTLAYQAMLMVAAAQEGK